VWPQVELPHEVGRARRHGGRRAGVARAHSPSAK
jgi:hypothetical protein